MLFLALFAMCSFKSLISSAACLSGGSGKSHMRIFATTTKIIIGAMMKKRAKVSMAAASLTGLCTICIRARTRHVKLKMVNGA